jgi:hypothetical protein
MLENLQLHAAVALASRCARRVQPILFLECRGADEVEEAIHFAEEFARGVTLDASQEPRFLRFDSDRPSAPGNYPHQARQHVAEAQLAGLYAGRAAHVGVRLLAGWTKVEDKRAWARQQQTDLFKWVEKAAKESAAATDPYRGEEWEMPFEEFSRRHPRQAAETVVARQALEWDFERLLHLRPRTYSSGNQPIEPSEAGPLGPLWKGEMPTWYAEGMQQRTAMPPLSIRRIVPKADVASLAEEVFQQESKAREPAQILCWHWRDFPDAKDLLFIAALREVYKSHKKLLPGLAVLGPQLLEEEDQKHLRRLALAGATFIPLLDPAACEGAELEKQLRLILAPTIVGWHSSDGRNWLSQAVGAPESAPEPEPPAWKARREAPPEEERKVTNGDYESLLKALQNEEWSDTEY